MDSGLKRPRPLPDPFPKPFKRCKYFSEGRCFKGKECTFLHELPTKKEEVKPFVPRAKPDYVSTGKPIPCKMLHSTGVCERGDHCSFSHDRMSPDQIQKFMEEHEHFLREVLEKKGETNLGDYFLQHLRKKEEVRAYDPPFRRGPPQPASPRRQLQIRLQRAGIIRKAELPSIDYHRLREAPSTDESACYSFPL